MKHNITKRTGERFARLAFELEALAARLESGDMGNEARAARAMSKDARGVSDGIFAKLDARENFGR